MDGIFLGVESANDRAACPGSIKHCGLPWEIGLAETHQTLVLNGLRDRVKVLISWASKNHENYLDYLDYMDSMDHMESMEYVDAGAAHKLRSF